MAARWLMAATLGMALAGCDPLPRPDYVDVKQPASFRTEPDGTRVDNADYKLDNQGYRINRDGERIGMVDVPAKTEGDNSNAVAGYYISTTGAVALPSEAPDGSSGSRRVKSSAMSAMRASTLMAARRPRSRAFAHP